MVVKVDGPTEFTSETHIPEWVRWKVAQLKPGEGLQALPFAKEMFSHFRNVETMDQARVNVRNVLQLEARKGNLLKPQVRGDLYRKPWPVNSVVPAQRDDNLLAALEADRKPAEEDTEEPEPESEPEGGEVAVVEATPSPLPFRAHEAMDSGNRYGPVVDSVARDVLGLMPGIITSGKKYSLEMNNEEIVIRVSLKDQP